MLTASTDASIREHNGAKPDSSSDPSVGGSKARRKTGRKATHTLTFLKSKKIPSLGYMNVNSSKTGSKINIVWLLSNSRCLITSICFSSQTTA